MMMKPELYEALGEVFALWDRIDIAISLPSGDWLRPDATSGRYKRFGGLDREMLRSIEAELWARALRAGSGIHWRPAVTKMRGVRRYALVDDVSDATARGIAARYRALTVNTSENCNQILLPLAREVAPMDQHRLQVMLVARLLSAGHYADRAATGAGQFGRLPGFPHPDHEGRVVRRLKLFQPADVLLDPDAVLALPMPTTDGDVAKVSTGPMAQRAIPVHGPGSPPAVQRRVGRPHQPVRPRHASGPATAAGGSERDFGWACGEIRRKRKLEELVERLATAALERDKGRDYASALAYAQRTVEGAAMAVRSGVARK